MTSDAASTPVPLVKLLTHHGGPELPDPIPLSEVPPEVRRAYMVLTAAALNEVIAKLEANPPEEVAALLRDDPDYAERWRNELNGMRTLEWEVQNITGRVMAQLYPFAHRYPPPADEARR